MAIPLTNIGFGNVSTELGQPSTSQISLGGSGVRSFLDISISSRDAQGTVSGYSSGGANPSITALNTIDKFPFASDANATDVGDLTQAREFVAGQSSTASGYTSGGFLSGSSRPAGHLNTVDKFPFAINANATDVGDLTQVRNRAAGQSSTVSGYSSGGLDDVGPAGVPGVFIPAQTDIIDKFPFASDANATDVGNLFFNRCGAAGQSSTVSGYTSGADGFRLLADGSTDFSASLFVGTLVQKFSFATDANVTDVGNLTNHPGTSTGRGNLAGQSSTVSGYSSGGIVIDGGPALRVNIIDKFPFATDANATDVGDLTQARGGVAGQSSTASGYISGGQSEPGPITNTIDKFPFATNANATDVGDLTQARNNVVGQQD